jgi:hypothetical protein
MTLIAQATTNRRVGSQHLVTVDVKTLYTKSIDESGWLLVKLASGEKVGIPEFVKVGVIKTDDRTHFVIFEGLYKGKKASLSVENAKKCLINTKRGNGAKLVAKIIGRKVTVSVIRNNEKRNQLWATLEFDGKKASVTLDSDVDYWEKNPELVKKPEIRHSKPLPEGTYKILAPSLQMNSANTGFYATHAAGFPGLKYHTAWFPIEYAPTKNSNFVHVGNLSEGCVTIYELFMWNPLYKYLISNRSDKEGKYVGTITITK